MKNKKVSDIVEIIGDIVIIFIGMAMVLVGAGVIGISMKLVNNLAIYATVENEEICLFLLNSLGIIVVWPTGLLITIVGYCILSVLKDESIHCDDIISKE